MSLNDLIYHHLYTTNLKKDEAQLDGEINTLLTELGLDGVDNLESVLENMISIKSMINDNDSSSTNGVRNDSNDSDNDNDNDIVTTPTSTSILVEDIDVSSQLAQLNEITNSVYSIGDDTTTTTTTVQYNKLFLKYQMLSSFITDLLNSMNSIDIYNDELLLDILNDCNYIQD